MSEKRRYVEAGYTYHVMNRGALKQKLFYGEDDYAHFERLIQETLERFPLSIFAYQLMPNHWHFVVRPADKDQLSDFFRQLSGTHAKRFRVLSETIGQGHVYQGRFKSLPVQNDHHFLSVCRYVERNALRAKLVSRAEYWRWGSLFRRVSQTDEWLESDWPVTRPSNWSDYVNQPMTRAELAEIQKCVKRGRPYGNPKWTHEAAKKLGLAHTLNRRGRPPLVRPKAQ